MEAVGLAALQPSSWALNNTPGLGLGSMQGKLWAFNYLKVSIKDLSPPRKGGCRQMVCSLHELGKGRVQAGRDGGEAREREGIACKIGLPAKFSGTPVPLPITP